MYYYGQNYGYPGYNSNYMYSQTQSSYISWLVIAIIIFVLLVIIAAPNRSTSSNNSCY